MKLITQRLALRPLKDSDAVDIVRGVGNLDVSKWLLVVPHPYTMEDARTWIEDNKAKWRRKKREDYTFGIELTEEHKIIGAMSIMHLSGTQGTAEIGYWIGPDYHGKGYGTEALRAVVDFSFNRLKLRRLEAGVFAENPSSGRLLEKIGFRNEGTRMQAKVSKATGQIHDEVMYGLLARDYLGK